MTEYKTFDDFVKDVLKVIPSKLTHLSPEEQKKEKVLIPIDSLISIWNEMVELQVQIEKMKNCFNCKHSIYNGGVCINPNKRYKDCRDYSSWELKE